MVQTLYFCARAWVCEFVVYRNYQTGIIQGDYHRVGNRRRRIEASEIQY
jgi:hypothetical protein